MNSQKYGFLLAFIVTFLASAGWLFTKMALRELAPMIFLAWRFWFAGLFLLLFCWRKALKVSFQHVLSSIKTGLCLALALCCWVEGMDKVAYIGEAAFIVSLMVVIVPFISWCYGSKPNYKLVVVLFPTVLGLYMLTGGQIGLWGEGKTLLFASAGLFSFHVVLSSQQDSVGDVMTFTVCQLLMVGTVAALFAVVRGEVLTGSLHELSWLTLSSFCASVILATSIRFVVLTRCLLLISANEASMVFVLTPLLTALLGWCVLSENMALIQWAGCAMIIASQCYYQWTT